MRTIPEHDSDPGKPRPHILVVDDHADTTLIIARILRMVGYEVSTAFSAEQAMELCRAGASFDLLITDIELPDGLGIEMLRGLREACKVPTIAVSAHAYQADVEAAMAAGFARYLIKPFDRETLLMAVQTTLNEPTKPCGETGPRSNGQSTV